MQNKLKKLFRGKRSFSKRIGLACFPSFAFSFLLFFSGPFDFTFENKNYFSFSLLNIIPVLALITGISFLIFLTAAAVPGGKIHAFLVCLYTGVSTAMYVQKTYLNPDFGVLDGHTVNWSSFSSLMLKNLVIWLLILLLPHFLHFLSNRFWRCFTVILSLVLILVQGYRIYTEISGLTKGEHSAAAARYLSGENMLKVGHGKNIVVFLLNETSNEDLKSLGKKFPEVLAPFHDFTYFDNANSHYMHTVPSLVNLLTAEEWNCETVHIKDYMSGAWNVERTASFYQNLSEDGFERNFYLHLPYLTDDASAVQNVISNLKQADREYSINYGSLLNLYKISFYHLCPLMLKPFFMLSVFDANDLIYRKDAFTDEWEFAAKMNENRLSAGNFQNAFIFYYLPGVHPPYQIDEKGQLISENMGFGSPDMSVKEKQLAGFLSLISDYLEQMRSMGLYDDLGIVILSDHGNNSEKKSDHQPVYLIKMPEEQREMMEENHAPITIQDSFLADVMEMTGRDGSGWGIPSAMVPDLPAERWTRTFAKDNSFPSIEGGSYNVMREYRYDRDGDYLTEIWAAGDFSVIPIIDSYY